MHILLPMHVPCVQTPYGISRLKCYKDILGDKDPVVSHCVTTPIMLSLWMEIVCMGYSCTKYYLCDFVTCLEYEKPFVLPGKVQTPLLKIGLASYSALWELTFEGPLMGWGGVGGSSSSVSHLCLCHIFNLNNVQCHYPDYH